VTSRLFNERYGLDDVELFQRHHRRMLDRLIEPNWEKKIPPNPELASYLKQSEMHGAVHVLLTNGSREWADSLAGRIGIRDCFRVISGADDHKLRQKGQSMVPYFSVLGRAGYFGDFSDVLVIEDSLKNMEEPKQCGMRNAWVRWGNPLKKGEVVPDFVDRVFDSPNDVAAAWLDARGIKAQMGFEALAINEKRRSHKRRGIKAPRHP
jgi:FMN phosphatase YigB (HAD superfamily)